MLGDVTLNDGTTFENTAKLDQQPKEAVQNARCVVAVINGDTGVAYFRQPSCLQELRWAREAGTPIKLVVAADASRPGASTDRIFDQAPDDLKDLSKSLIIHLDCKRPAYWETGVKEVHVAINELAAAAARAKIAHVDLHARTRSSFPLEKRQP